MFCMETKDWQPLLDYIEQSRLRRGWSWRELSRKTEIASSTLSYWKQGKARPDPASLQKLAAVLEIDEAYLLRLAGYLEDRPQGLHNAAAIDLARRIEELPPQAQEEAIEALRAMLDAIYNLIHLPPPE
jgi:transcriptional regulator with XRE-family HTH domain